MNIDDHVNSIVQNIVSEITASVQQKVAEQIDAKISSVIASIDATGILAEQISKKLDIRIGQLPIDTKTIESQITARLDGLTTSLVENIQRTSINKINESVNSHVKGIDFASMFQAALTSLIQNQTFKYPAESIPHNAINTTGFILTGNNIRGGIIENFGSTGIDDQATSCQLTILDETTVVENNLLTKDLTVKGTVNIEGDLNITGTVPESSAFYLDLVNRTTDNVRANLDRDVFVKYAEIVTETIKENGLDLTKITYNGQEIINGGNLGNHITYSNLQRVGQLRDLQTIGESLLSETLYTTTKRVGINTVEPSQALSVWDQEIEIGVGKRETNVGVIGTPRTQTLIISSNNKDNLTLTPDGAVRVNQLNLGQISLTAAFSPPNVDMPLGSIVFNANPSLGGPLGWVSLGDARWANFGIID